MTTHKVWHVMILYKYEKRAWDAYRSWSAKWDKYSIIEPVHVIPTMWHFDKCRLRRVCAASCSA